jgi:hypothetical protein
VTEHLNAFNIVVSQLLSVDIKISDEDKCISLLFSLPDSWDSLEHICIICKRMLPGKK